MFQKRSWIIPKIRQKIFILIVNKKLVKLEDKKNTKNGFKTPSPSRKSKEFTKLTKIGIIDYYPNKFSILNNDFYFSPNKKFEDISKEYLIYLILAQDLMNIKHFY